jgi:hypothetical protein
MTPAHYRSVSLQVRVGVALGAIAAVLVAIAPTWGLVEGPARGAPSTTAAVGLDASVGVFGIVTAVLILGSAAAPQLWAHLTGLGVSTLVLSSAGLLVRNGRRSEDFEVDADLSLLGGGVVLVVAFWAALAAVIVALVGFRRVAMTTPAPEQPLQEEPAGPGRARTSSKAATALVISAAGFFTAGVGSSIGIALGALTLGEIRASGGRVAGRGVATAALVVGMIILSLIVAFGGVEMLSATPTD